MITRGGSTLSQTRRMTKCFLREYNNLFFQELLFRDGAWDT